MRVTRMCAFRLPHLASAFLSIGCRSLHKLGFTSSSRPGTFRVIARANFLIALLLCSWHAVFAQISLLSKSGDSICGRISDDGLQPLRSARVNAFLSGADSSWIPPVWSDAEGKFCVKDLKSGEYKLTVNHPGYISVEQSVSLWDNRAEVSDIVLLRAVGELTDVSRVITQGNTTFREKAIHSALLGDSTIVLASHPM